MDLNNNNNNNNNDYDDYLQNQDREFEEYGEYLFNLNEKHNIELKNKLNLFLNKDESNIDKLSFLYKKHNLNEETHSLNISHLNLIVQIEDITIEEDGNDTITISDSKFKYICTNYTQIQLHLFFIFKIIEISKENVGFSINKIEILSTSYRDLVFKDTKLHPSVSKYYFYYQNSSPYISQSNNSMVEKEIEQLLLTVNNNNNNNMKNFDFRISKIIIKYYIKLKKEICLILNSKSSSVKDISPYFINFNQDFKIQKIITANNINKLLSIYLFSVLNKIENYSIEYQNNKDSIDIIQVYRIVLTNLVIHEKEDLSTINYIHKFYERVCKREIDDIGSEYKRDVYYSNIINSIIHLFNNSIQSVYNRIIIENERDEKLKFIKLNNDGIGSSKLVKVYNQEVIFNFNCKPQLFIDNNVFDKNKFDEMKYEELISNHVIEYTDLQSKYKSTGGSISINPSLDLFKTCFSMFSNGIFDHHDFNWVNDDGSDTKVVVSGGSITACLDPLPFEIKIEYIRLLQIKRILYKSKLSILLVNQIMELVELDSTFNQLLYERYHVDDSFYYDSDIDLFIISNNLENAKIAVISVANQIMLNLDKKKKKKFKLVYINDSISIEPVYQNEKFRKIKIALSIHNSIDELVSLVDLDCVSSIYDGDNVYMSKRSIRAFNTRTNYIPFSLDFKRIVKYSLRGFKHVVVDYPIGKFLDCDNEISYDTKSYPSHNQSLLPSLYSHKPIQPFSFDFIYLNLEIINFNSNKPVEIFLLDEIIEKVNFKISNINLEILGLSVLVKCPLCKDKWFLQHTTDFNSISNHPVNMDNSISLPLNHNDFKDVINRINVVLICDGSDFGIAIAYKLLLLGFNIIIASTQNVEQVKSNFDKKLNLITRDSLKGLKIIEVDFNGTDDSVKTLKNQIKSICFRIDILIYSIHKLSNNNNNNNYIQETTTTFSNEKKFIKYFNYILPKQIYRELSDLLYHKNLLEDYSDNLSPMFEEFVWFKSYNQYIDLKVLDKTFGNNDNIFQVTGLHIAFDINGTFEIAQQSIKSNNITEQTISTIQDPKQIVSYQHNSVKILSPDEKEIKKFRLFHNHYNGKNSNLFSSKRTAQIINIKQFINDQDAALLILNKILSFFFSDSFENVYKFKISPQFSQKK